MIVDKNRKLIEVNPTFCQILGYTKDELIGNSAEMIHISHETYKDFGERAFKLVRKNKTVNLENHVLPNSKKIIDHTRELFL